MDLHTRKILMSSGKLKDEKDYWLKRLEGDTTVSSFPADFSTGNELNIEIDKYSHQIKSNICERILSVSGDSSLARFVILLAGVKYMLYLYTYNENIIIGMPSLKNDSLDSNNGMFALKTSIASTFTGKELLNEVKNTVKEAIKNANITFNDIAEELCDLECINEKDFFKTIVLLKGLHDEKDIEDINSGIIFRFSIQNNEIELDVEYNKKIYAKKNIEKMLEYLEIFYIESLMKPEAKLCDLGLPFRVNNNESIEDYIKIPENSIIHRRFEEKALEIPQRVAVVSKGGSITYSELNKKANCIARELKKMGVSKDSVVGLMLGRTVDTIAAILGILKAGGAYMPIDLDYPIERIEYMMEDSGAKALLTIEEQTRGLNLKNKVLFVDKIEVIEENSKNLNEPVKDDNLAYVIYTSGTTGKPKGVMIEHRNVANLVYGINERVYGLYEQPLNVALLAPFVFDASIKQIFPSILLGHTLFIVPEDIRFGGSELIRYYIDNNIDISDATPIHIEAMNVMSEHGYEDLSVKHFMIGGEALSWNSVNRFLKIWKNSRMTNVYGPTECCDVVTTYDIENNSTELYQSIVPIGKALPNTSVYILDTAMNQLPINAIGELYISGDGVGRGYINKNELTEERYLADRFKIGRKMYKTGDLVRRLADGNIEFIGRKDNQVKIRGFRIETTEIEHAMLRYPDIRNAVVTTYKNTNGVKQLCAYYTTSGDEISLKALKDYLKEKLPNYMIPSFFIQLEKLPVTHNGKINLRALPEPLMDQMNKEIEYESPSDDIELEVQNIWHNILGRDSIGINENFFDAGGDSFLLIQVHSMIDKKYPKKIKLIDLFIHSTIKQMAELIKDNTYCKSDDFELKAINIDIDYLLASPYRGQRNILKYELSEIMLEELQKYSSKIGVDAKSILIGVYAYLFKEITQDDDIVIQTISKYDDFIMPLEVGFEGMEEFSELPVQIYSKLKLADKTVGCSINKLQRRFEFENQKGIVPLFCIREHIISAIALHDFFDIIIEIDLFDNYLALKCDYDTGILKQEMIKQFFNKYLKVLEFVIKQA